MSSTIRIEHVSKSFEAGKPVLRDLNLEIRPSEIVSLLGPSGCGKSTLLRLLSGLERDHEGHLLIDGQEVLAPTRAVGLMFQEPRLLPWLTVRNNILFGLNARDRRQADGLAQELMEQVQLSGCADLLPRQLSGGMAQRVALARALATEPGVLLLDEPFSAVDALTRMRLQELLLSVWQRRRFTMLLVTHDIDEALYLSDRVAVLSGRPATVREIVHVDLPRPRDRRAAEMLRLRAYLLEALRIAGAPQLTGYGTPFGV
ncbi:MAG: ABC transporter ATP-binding protein [Anaerolineae bacterium]|nr:ABC transporter ATP-binding protein [Thermoflexales bacterium]MDW8407295.1 ABC transporter ATP-binding protein [Anaerolineae bacterium]